MTTLNGWENYTYDLYTSNDNLRFPYQRNDIKNNETLYINTLYYRVPHFAAARALLGLRAKRGIGFYGGIKSRYSLACHCVPPLLQRWWELQWWKQQSQGLTTVATAISKAAAAVVAAVTY